jgi:putative transcription antitermination factor YqgF
MGLDVGERYCGVAVTDATNLRAQPLDVLHRKEDGAYINTTAERRRELQKDFDQHYSDKKKQISRKPTWWKPVHPSRVREIVVRPLEAVARDLRATVLKYKVQGIIVGLPLMADGEATESSDRVEAFIEAMAEHTAFGPEVEVFWKNEYMSTRMAQELLKERGSRAAKEDKQLLDKMCACLVLNRFIATNFKRPEPKPKSLEE